VQSRSLLCPRGCVPGQGLCRLPGSALSVPGELPRALRGDVWGEGAPGRAGQGRAGQGRAGQGPSADRAAAWGGGLTATLHQGAQPGILQGGKQGRDFPCPLCREGRRLEL